MLTHQNPRLEDILEFPFSMPVHRDLSNHLPTKDSDYDSGYFAKELWVLKNPQAKASFARYRDHDVAMGHLWQTLNKISGGLLSSALYAGGTDASLAAKCHTHLDSTAVTCKASDPVIRVSTKLQGTEGLLNVWLERAIGVAEPAIVGREKVL